ncbi:MAG: metal-dependent transcriptional regulator [Methanobacteriaceae archaeon]
MSNINLDSKDLQDYIRNIWVKEIEKKETVLESDFDNIYTAELFKEGYINIDNGKITLTIFGEKLARELVRKHRLAERVMADLFLADNDETEYLAHELEHIMSHEVESNICRFLGHPNKCPHNNKIPKGSCCDEMNDLTVKSLRDVEKDFFGEVAYIKTKDRKKLQKIMSMGLMPGSTIELIQKFPVFVFQVGQSQLAVDEDIANEIFVKTIN